MSTSKKQLKKLAPQQASSDESAKKVKPTIEKAPDPLVASTTDDELKIKVKKNNKPSKPTKSSKKKITPPIQNNSIGVLYIGHLPNGFFEMEIRGFLSQFGKVLATRVSRSKRTGNSKGFAYVQMEDEAVASIVQKTLHGYILMGKTIVCQHVPAEHVHAELFQGGLIGDKKTFTPMKVNWKRVAMKQQDAVSEEGKLRRIARLNKQRSARMQSLKEKGYDYEIVNEEDSNAVVPEGGKSEAKRKQRKKA